MPKENHKNTSSAQSQEGKENWFSNHLHQLVIGISIVWCALVFVYITQVFGWLNLFALMPDEF